MNQLPPQKEHQKESPFEKTKPLSSPVRLARVKSIVSLAIAMTVSGCVYHRQGSNKVHLFSYDRQDAAVVFPWRTTREFKQEYHLAVIASIAIWFSYPYELLEGLTNMDIKKIICLLPAISYAYENDSLDIERKAKDSKVRRSEAEWRKKQK